MKMLEKVVKALEICGKADPSMCPYFDTKHWGCCTGHIQGYSPVKDDAYSYLREYLNYQKLQKMVNKSDSLSDTENKPLSWEELKQMVGKPVWIEYFRRSSCFDSEWVILKDINDSCMSDTEHFGYDADEYGRTWIAYKQERK